MQVQVVVKVASGDVYKGEKTDGISESDLYSLREMISELRNLNSLHLKVSGNYRYFNPRYIESVELRVNP